METSDTEPKAATVVVTEVYDTPHKSKTPFLGEEDIKKGKRSSVICCNELLTSQSLLWHEGKEAERFIETLPAGNVIRGKESDQQASFTLVAGTGNGTLDPVSIEPDLWNTIKIVLGFPDFFSGIIERVLGSIHGVIASFREEKFGQKFLLIIFSSPKAPLREIFCAMRINLTTFSTTCLLFDLRNKDLKILRRNLEQNFTWRNPLVILAMLTRECGQTTEEKRAIRDKQILFAEEANNSTLWKTPQRKPEPQNYRKTITELHICHNTLTFIDQAVAFEINVWKFLQQLLSQKVLNDMGLFEQVLDEGYRQFFVDSVSFELNHTMSKKLQISGLQNRVKVQQSLVDNLIAGQQANQTLMLSILAAIFASSSLVASIFSCGIFRIRERAWVIYVVSTVALTIITVGLAMFYFKLPIMWFTLKRTSIGLKLIKWKGQGKKKGDTKEPLEV